jgi:hypothetical protein
MAAVKNLLEFTTFLNKRSAYLVMFGHIEAVRLNLPSVSVEQAMGQFLDKYDLDIELRSAMREYYRMQKELIELSRTEAFLGKRIGNVV